MNVKTVLIFIPIFMMACQSEVTSLDDLMQTDRDFSAFSVSKGMHEAFLEYIAEDGIMLKPDAMPQIGKDKLRALYAQSNDSSFTLSWEPIDGRLAQSAELGFTYGIWTLQQKDTTTQGTYVSIWQKDSVGQWKFVLDSGNNGLGN